MMKKLFRPLSILILLLNMNFVFGWGKTGHRVVAEIAEQNLNLKAKRQIKKIIGKQTMAYWANYPDFIKSDPELYKATSSWHYINFPENIDRQQFDSILKNSSEKNLYKRIQILMDDLENRKDLSKDEQIKALYFLVHLIGDLHQPLHTGRESDLGGNKIKISWFGEKTNLHSLWDDELVDYQKYSYTEFARVLDVHDKEFKKNLVAGSLEDWFYDSYLESKKIYSGVKADENLKYSYDYENVDLLQTQLLKAGLRLAKILNQIFG